MHWKRAIYKNPELSSARRGNGFSRQVAIRAALSGMSGKNERTPYPLFENGSYTATFLMCVKNNPLVCA